MEALSFAVGDRVVFNFKSQEELEALGDVTCNAYWSKGLIERRTYTVQAVSSNGNIKIDDHQDTLWHNKHHFSHTEKAPQKENTHYDAGGIETIDFIKAKLTKDQLIGGFLFNILKYAGRFNFKHDDPLADAKKIRDYAQQLVDTLED